MLSRDIVITGAGVLSPAGQGLDATMEALMAGLPLLRALDEPWARPPHDLGGRVGEFSVGASVPKRKLRRISRISRMALCVAHQALEQAGLTDSPEVGVVLGTGLGALEETVDFMDQIIQEGAGAATPGLFPSSVMNVAAAQVSMVFGLRGYNTTVNHKEVSAELALGLAMDAIRLGHADALLAGGVDELSWPVHHGYRRLHALGREASPYGLGRDGLVLGEGAAVLALEAEEHALARGATVLARLSGAASAGGERPLVSWGPGEVEAGARAARLALDQAGLAPAQVDLVIGSGCGSPELDRLEARVSQEVFDGQAVPVTSPHGTLGSWMSGGALRAACGLGALLGRRVFPTVTRGGADPEAPLPGLVTAPVEDRELQAVVSWGHATGGASAAVVMQRHTYSGG